MGNTRRSVIAAAAAAITLVAGGTFASATPDVGALETFRRYAQSNTPTNNIATDGFVKTTGGVYLSYDCVAEGVKGNIQVQITNAAQTVAYRTFDANCIDRSVALGSLNVPSNTVMRARIHAYDGAPFRGGVFASGTGYCFDIASSRQEACLA